MRRTSNTLLATVVALSPGAAVAQSAVDYQEQMKAQCLQDVGQTRAYCECVTETWLDRLTDATAPEAVLAARLMTGEEPSMDMMAEMMGAAKLSADVVLAQQSCARLSASGEPSPMDSIPETEAIIEDLNSSSITAPVTEPTTAPDSPAPTAASTPVVATKEEKPSFMSWIRSFFGRGDDTPPAPIIVAEEPESPPEPSITSTPAPVEAQSDATVDLVAAGNETGRVVSLENLALRLAADWQVRNAALADKNATWDAYYARIEDGAFLSRPTANYGELIKARCVAYDERSLAYCDCKVDNFNAVVAGRDDDVTRFLGYMASSTQGEIGENASRGQLMADMFELNIEYTERFNNQCIGL